MIVVYLKAVVQIIIVFLSLVFVTFDPIDYTVTEGLDAFAVLTLVRSGVTSETTVVTVTPMSGTAFGNYNILSQAYV